MTKLGALYQLFRFGLQDFANIGKYQLYAPEQPPEVAVCFGPQEESIVVFPSAIQSQDEVNRTVSKRRDASSAVGV